MVSPISKNETSTDELYHIRGENMDLLQRKYEIHEEIDHLMVEVNWISTRIIELKTELEEMREEHESSL